MIRLNRTTTEFETEGFAGLRRIVASCAQWWLIQRVRVWLLTLGIVLLPLFLGEHLSSAQTASEYQVKAAYLYNFAKFVEWPSGGFPSATAPIRLCVLNDSSFQSELVQIVKSKTIAGRPLEVVPVQSAEQARSCQILFINSSQRGQTQHVIDVLRDSSVLTVGETQGFVEHGGMINFVLQDDRVQFEVNHKAAKQAGLSISARLLAVAKAVVE